KLCIRPKDVERRAAAYVSRGRGTTGVPGTTAALYLGSSRCARPLNTPPRSRSQPSGHVAHPSRSIHQGYGSTGEVERSENGIRKRRTPKSVKERGSHGASPAQC